MKLKIVALTLYFFLSHPARGAWIEISRPFSRFSIASSHPARGAWIEISRPTPSELYIGVAPRKGCVD